MPLQTKEKEKAKPGASTPKATDSRAADAADQKKSKAGKGQDFAAGAAALVPPGDAKLADIAPPAQGGSWRERAAPFSDMISRNVAKLRSEIPSMEQKLKLQRLTIGTVTDPKAAILAESDMKQLEADIAHARDKIAKYEQQLADIADPTTPDSVLKSIWSHWHVDRSIAMKHGLKQSGP